MTKNISEVSCGFPGTDELLVMGAAVCVPSLLYLYYSYKITPRQQVTSKMCSRIDTQIANLYASCPR